MDRSELSTFLRRLSFGLTGVVVSFMLLGWSAYRWPDIAVDLGYPKAWVKVLQRIRAAERGTSSDTLYLGDSVAGQLLPYDGDQVLTSNGSVYPLGNYLLARNAIRNSPNLTTVVYMTVPHVLGHKFERRRTWGNFVKPFISRDVLPLLDDSSAAVLQAHPRTYALMFPPMKFLPLSDVDLENGGERPLDALSPFAMHWLAKLMELCEQHNIELLLVSPPVGEYLREATGDWQRMKAQVAGGPLEELIEQYLSTVRYHPDRFLTDRTHWDPAYVEQNRARMVREMLTPMR